VLHFRCCLRKILRDFSTASQKKFEVGDDGVSFKDVRVKYSCVVIVEW
jgi:hypothetical protein